MSLNVFGRNKRQRCNSIRAAGKRFGANRRRGRSAVLAIEALEDRCMLAGVWTPLNAAGAAPDYTQALMLLSDGSVMVQEGNDEPTTTMFKLSPQAFTGSYVNGVWSNIADLNEDRLFFTTTMLPDAKVFAIGGEYPWFSNTAEVYDSLANTWTYVDPIPTSPLSNFFISGSVTGATNTSPITITVGPYDSTAGLQNGDTVTIAGVAGNTAANGTRTITNVTDTTFDLVGSNGTASGVFFDNGLATWRGPNKSQFGDDPIQVLSAGPNAGQILAGHAISNSTYRFNPSGASGSQWTTTAAAKLHNDASDEETWVKLPDGSILSYDIFGSESAAPIDTFKAQRYIPATDKWVDASNLDPTNPPSVLTGANEGYELGPAFLQPDGNVILFGANGNTAIYNPSTDIWTAGPEEPQKNLTIGFDGSVTPGGSPTYLVGTDNPGAMLPNGKILITLSPHGPVSPFTGGYSFPDATYIYEYDPVTQKFIENTPAGVDTQNAFFFNMVVLPTGQVLLGNSRGDLQVYTPDGGPQNAWRPVISNVQDNGDGTFTLTGRQLNGISEGATYGDDWQSASNYPIVRLKDAVGNVYYARTYDWSSTGVATGSTVVTTQFTLPAGRSLSDFASITAIANGISSREFPLTRSLLNGSGGVDIVGRTASGQWWVGHNDGTSFTNEQYGSWVGSSMRDVSTGDFDGDGFTDVIGRSVFGNWTVGHNTGSSFVNQSYGKWYEAVGWHDVTYADFTGDGLTDVIGRTSQGQWWLGVNDGSQFVNQLFGYWDESANWRDVLAGDFNGDGTLDIVGRTSTGQWWLASNNGTTFVNQPYGGWYEGVGWRDVMAADFNSDGATDIVGRTASGGWWLGISSGGATFSNISFGQWSEAAGWHDVMVGDFTGDGVPDVAGRTTGGDWWVGQTSFVLGAFQNRYFGGWGLITPNNVWRDVMQGDFDSDGRLDVLGRNGITGVWWLGRNQGSFFYNNSWGSWNESLGWRDVSSGNFGPGALAAETSAETSAMADGDLALAAAISQLNPTTPDVAQKAVDRALRDELLWSQ